MCYSFKTSLISYILGISSAIFAILTNQIVLGVFILVYSQIQFAEMLIWHGIDTNNDNMNRLGTSYGKYILVTHNIAIGLGILLYISFVKKEELKIYDFWPLIAGIVFFICVLIFYSKSNKLEKDLTYPLNRNCEDVNKCQNMNNRLNWPWSYNWYYISFAMSIIIFLLYIKPVESCILFLSVFIGTFLLFNLIFDKLVVGSLWCFSAAILAPLLVIVNYFIIEGKNVKDVLT